MNLSSQNKRILIISDSHQDWNRLDKILTKEDYDIAVHAGDWFDSFDYNSTEDVEKTCNLLRKWIFKDNFFTLWGNHDFYLYGNTYTICSGYTKEKDKLITNIFGKDLPAIRDKFLWYLFIDDFLCTHAGLHPYHIHSKVDPTNKEQLVKWLNREVEQTKLHLEFGGSYWTYRAGRARGGNQKIGGITWLDWDGEFEPIEGLNQMVGHSFQQNNKIDIRDNNYCIDTNLNEYLMICNGKIKIKNYIDL